MSYDDDKTQTLGTALILAISHGLPPVIGHPVAAALSYVIGNRYFSPTFRAISQNQWVAHDGKLTPQQLRHKIRQVYQNQGRLLYDFYHNLDRPDEINKLVSLSASFQKMVDECKSGRMKQGTLLLMPHVSGFNLAGLYLAKIGFRFLSLAIPNPNHGYAWQNKIRNDRGMEVIPMDLKGISIARKRLQRGGVVLTGVDRPWENTDHHPLFFGRPAELPVAYIKLALRTNARVFGVGFRTRPDHSCVVDLSPQIEMESSDDPNRELLLNAEKVLKVLEAFIRVDPTQWMMFLPVWPGVQQEMPTI